MKSFKKQKLNNIFSIIFVFFTLFFLNTKSLIAETNQNMKFNDVNELAEYFKAVALGVKNKPIKLLENMIRVYNF